MGVKKTPRTKPLLLTKLFLASVLLGYLGFVINWPSLYKAVQNVSIFWLTLSVFYIPAGYIIFALRNRVLLDGQIPFRAMLQLVVLQGALSTFLSSAAGAAAQVAVLIKKHNIYPAQAIRSTIMSKVADTCAALAAVTLLLTLARNEFSQIHTHLTTGIAITSGLLFGLLVVTLLISNTRSAAELTVTASRNSLFRHWAAIVIAAFHVNRRYALSILPMAFAYSIVLQVVIAVAMYLNARAFGIEVTLLQAAVIGIISSFIASLPISVFGGLGVYEASTIGLFALYNIPIEKSAGMMLVVRTLFFLITGAALLPLIAKARRGGPAK